MYNNKLWSISIFAKQEVSLGNVKGIDREKKNGLVCIVKTPAELSILSYRSLTTLAVSRPKGPLEKYLPLTNLTLSMKVR